MHEITTLKDNHIHDLPRSSGASRHLSSNLMPKGLSFDGGPITTKEKSQTSKENAKHIPKSIDRHTPLLLPDNLIKRVNHPPPVPPSTAEFRAVTPMPTWENVANNCSIDNQEVGDDRTTEDDNFL